MKYAEVAVNSPISSNRSFSYSIPLHLEIKVGQAVWVPFGSRTLQGIVIKISDHSSVEITKDIIGFISPVPLLSSRQIDLGLWLSTYYCAPLFDCLALMLPPGFERKLITLLVFSGSVQDTAILNDQDKEIADYIKNKEKVNIKELEKKFGKKKTQFVVKGLIHRGMLSKIEYLEEPRVKPKLVQILKLNIGESEVQSKADQLRGRGAYKQAEVLEFLQKQKKSIQTNHLRKSVDCENAVVRSLLAKGLVSVNNIEQRRDPLAHLHISATSPPVFTSSQQEAWTTIKKAFASDNKVQKSTVFLLKGVTGSGKTEIYLKALGEVISRGRRGICLVPEIALTAQTIERFASRFPGRIAVLHSGLSIGERFDEWNRIKRGECDVVIGPRSAIFAPQPDLGLIIIDEEHEWTYKQTDKSPRYHTRDTALELAKMNNAVVILGSATPDLETFYKAKQGVFVLVEIKERITPRGISPLPAVEVVDLCGELKAGNQSLFSRSLLRAMKEVLSRHEQVILFLNRRGTATFVQCRSCGFVHYCKRCMAPVTYHASTKKLVCHHCRYSYPTLKMCPVCQGNQFRYVGVGTEKVEEETRYLFPAAKVFRWDSDVTSSEKSNREIMDRLKDHDIDILIGTQIIAKGLDIPDITLAGMINADTGLNFPDFRSAERTFQLACQLAGRAGRGLEVGRVIIQTYNPEHYAIQAASLHDYEEFYNKEITYRSKYHYPPFSQMARLLYKHTNADVCRRQAETLSQLLIKEKRRKGVFNLRLVGPIPAFIPKVRGFYQWQIIMLGFNICELLEDITFSRGWIIDIDPVSVI